MNNFITKIFKKPIKIYGTHGRIEIPSLRISIPLYNTNGNAQEIVDKKNSAAYIQWKNQAAIVDHSGQDGFERLAKAIPNSTIAYIDQNGKREKYLCVKKQIGHIKLGNKNQLVDANWKSADSNNGLVMYTCIKKSASDIMDVWLIYWKKIGG